LQEIVTNFFEKYFVKTLFATNFIENIYKFYNFVKIITYEGITC